MADAIDTAYVDIRPDFTGFAAQTRAGIKTNLAAVGGGAAGGASLKRAGKDADAAAGSLKRLSSSATSAGGSMALMGGTAARSATIASAGIAGLAAGVAIAGVKAAQASIAFESAFAGVRKTVQATAPRLAEIRKNLIDMSTEIPVAATELAAIAENAGALGVKTSAIEGFTKTIAELGATTNLTQDEAATAFAQIANITQLPQTQFANMGSTVVDLGNKLAATEADITNFGLRIAGAGKQIGLSNAEILSIGAALASVGLEAEAGGTAISTTMVKIASAVAGGGAKLKAFADVAGTTSEKFATEFRTKPAQAIVEFVKGLSRVKAEGGNVFATLNGLGLGGIRVRDALLRSAGAGTLLTKALRIGGDAWQENTALQRAFGARADTTGAQLTILGNEITAVGIAAGDKLTPGIKAGVKGLTGFIADLRAGKGAGETIRQAFENVRHAIEPLFAVFERNRHVIVDTFQNAATSVRTLLVVLKPVGYIVGGVLVAAFESLFFALDKVNTVSRLFGDAIRKSVQVAAAAIDKFLGVVSFMTGALDRIPGIDMSGVTKAINGARESIRRFEDDLGAVDGKTVKASVDLDTSAADKALDEMKRSLAGIGSQIDGIRTDVTGLPTFGITKLPTKATGAGATPPPKPKPKLLGKVPTRIQKQEQALQDAFSIASSTRSQADDQSALARLKAFYDEQASNLKLAVSLRRSFAVKSAQAQEQLRGIDDQIRSDAQDSAESHAREAISAADATKGTLRDDIAARRTLIGVLKQRVQIAKDTNQGVAAAEAAVADARRDLVEKIREQTTRRVDLRVAGAERRVRIADSTEKNLKDDITTRQRLVGALRRRLAVIRATKGDVQGALDALRDARRDLRSAIKTAAAQRADMALDAISDQKELASFTKGTADDRRALTAEERFWKHRVASLKKGSVERRKAFVQLRRTQKDLRDLKTAGKKTKDVVGGTSLADLFKENQANLAKGGNLSGITTGAANAPIAGLVQHQLDLKARSAAIDLKAPSDAPERAVVRSNEALVDALERLTAVVGAAGNSGAGTGDGGTTHVSVEGQRWQAAARFYQNRRNRRLHEELANG